MHKHAALLAPRISNTRNPPRKWSCCCSALVAGGFVSLGERLLRAICFCGRYIRQIKSPSGTVRNGADHERDHQKVMDENCVLWPKLLGSIKLREEKLLNCRKFVNMALKKSFQDLY